MKEQLRLLLALAMVSIALLAACQSSHSGMAAHEVWARTGVKDGNGAVYMVLHNHSSKADELVGAASDVAQTVELHKSEVNDQGVMVMLKQDSIPLSANGEVIMEPGGYHIMLIGLKRDLKEGDTFKVTLKFKSSPDLTLDVAVRGGGMEMQPHGEHDHGSGEHEHEHPMNTPTP